MAKKLILWVLVFMLSMAISSCREDTERALKLKNLSGDIEAIRFKDIPGGSIFKSGGQLYVKIYDFYANPVELISREIQPNEDRESLENNGMLLIIDNTIYELTESEEVKTIPPDRMVLIISSQKPT